MTGMQDHKPLIMGGGIILALIVLGVAGYFLFEDKDAWQHALEAFLNKARGTPWALPLVCLTYVAGGMIFFPVMVLNLASAVVFGLWGIAYSLIGALMSASVIFGIGRLLHKKQAHKFLQYPKIKKIDKGFNHAGIAGVVTLHTIPVPPFTMVNLGAGLSSIHYWVYITGTFVALLPGALARGIVGDSLTKILLNPTPETYAYLAIGIALWASLIAGSHFAVKKLNTA